MSKIEKEKGKRKHTQQLYRAVLCHQTGLGVSVRMTKKESCSYVKELCSRQRLEASQNPSTTMLTQRSFLYLYLKELGWSEVSFS